MRIYRAMVSAKATLATQRALRVRFERLWRRTATIHTGWERGLWLRGPLLAEDYAHRSALVRFLRTELVPFVASGSRVIEDFVERLDAAARTPDAHNVPGTCEVEATAVATDTCLGPLSFPPGAPPGYMPPKELWWRRVKNKSGVVVLAAKCLRRYDHQYMTATEPIPGAVRWRWIAKDENSWGGCHNACCQ